MPVAGMPEARRREYLAALGIPLFVARVPLPGAAASVVDLVAPEPAMPLPVLAVTAPAAAAVRPSAPALAEAAALLQQPPRRPEVAATPAPVVAAITPAVTVSEAAPPSFTCRLVLVAPQLAVLLDLGAYPDLGTSERQLWQAICRAMAWSPQSLAADFSWPLTAGGKPGGLLGNGPDAARAFLQGWLGRDLAADDRLLVLGPALAPFVERPHRLLPALAELLTSPLAKRALWQQLAFQA